MEDIPPQSYGPLIETTARIITWNVWGLHGPWPQREPAIIATLGEARPDIVVLTESWARAAKGPLAAARGPQLTQSGQQRWDRCRWCGSE
jgi:exonuclease III